MGDRLKHLIYRFAIWLESRALDLQDWAAPEIEPLDYNEVLIGGINRESTELWKNSVEHNALLKKLSEK